MATAAQADNPEVIAARFNEYAAAATVGEILGRSLPSMELRQKVGTLTAHALVLPVSLYDPEANYRRVRGKWWGLGVE